LEERIGDKITRFFVIRSIEYRAGKTGSGGYVVTEFGDKNGRISGYIWDDAEKVIKEYKTGDIVKIRGTLEIYKDKKRISVDRIRKLKEGDPVKWYDFVPQYEGNIDKLKNDFLEEVNSIKNPFLKELLDSFFKEEKFFKDFCIAPGGKLWHHCYTGGLLEHTLSVVKICKKVAEIYKNVDVELLIVGAILHDIGKVREYNITPFIDYSDEGRLLGHIVMGMSMVEEKIKIIRDFPEELKKRILHMILSHQGTLENGSPVVPMTLEAIILHNVENLDSKANAYTRIIKNENEPGKKWSRYVNLIDRFIYFGDEDKEE